MAKRVFLHVGTPKTGTTYLQSVLWANKAVLRDQGLLLPLRSVSEHFHLSNIGRRASIALATMPANAHSAWKRMLDEVGDWNGDALISHELFSLTSAERAVWCLESLGTVADEVHTIVTGRDLARQVPAEWQQTIKHGRTHRLREFYDLLRADDPTVAFGRAQDLVSIMHNWSQGLPPGRAHIVTVPPLGAPRDLLWNRFATLVGIDPGSVDQSVNRPNESLGRVEIETLRRTNVYAPRDIKSPRRQFLTRQVLAEGILANRAGAQRFAPPADEHPWVVERGTAMVDTLRSQPYDVVGDLDELLPPSEPVTGLNPDDAAEGEVAQVAVETIATLLFRSQVSQNRILANQVAELTAQLEARSVRIHGLERQLRKAWGAYERERDLALWKHAGRRVRDGARRIRRRGNGPG